MHISRWAGVAPIVPFFQLLSSCGGGAATSTVRLQGAGSGFPALLYSKSFKTYGAAHKKIQVDYQSAGSGSGAKGLIEKTVDFGASDAAMPPEATARVDVGAQLLPMTAGSIVLAYTLPGVTELKLSCKACTGILLGKAKKSGTPWNGA